MLPTSGWFHHPVFHLPFGVGSQVGTAFQKMWSDAGESGHSESRGKKRRWRGAWGPNYPRNQKCSVGYQLTVSLLEDIAFQGYDLAVLSTMPGEWHIQGDLSIDDDKMMCLEYGSAMDTLGFQQRVNFLMINDINVHFYMCTISHLYLEHLYESKHVLKCLYTNHQFIIQRSTPIG